VEEKCCGRSRCVTAYNIFYKIVLDPHVLGVAILNRVDIRADPADFSDRSYRKAAYRQYILWAHKHLGRGNRKVAPSCVVKKIRRHFPSATGQYMGFRPYQCIEPASKPFLILNQ
jgi:P2X purinoceptor 7